MAYCLEVPCQRGVDDNNLRVSNRNAMSETLPGQIAVQERGDATRLGTTRPDTNVFGPVRHEQRDRVAFAQTARAHPARIAVRVAVPLAIGEALAIRDERQI